MYLIKFSGKHSTPRRSEILRGSRDPEFSKRKRSNTKMTKSKGARYYSDSSDQRDSDGDVNQIPQSSARLPKLPYAENSRRREAMNESHAFHSKTDKSQSVIINDKIEQPTDLRLELSAPTPPNVRQSPTCVDVLLDKLLTSQGVQPRRKAPAKKRPKSSADMSPHSSTSVVQSPPLIHDSSQSNLKEKSKLSSTCSVLDEMFSAETAVRKSAPKRKARSDSPFNV